MNAFVPARFSIWSHTHTHNHLTILCFMSHFNGQCFQCSVFHFNCNYNCGQFFFLQIFEERQNWPATVIFVHEQMSIITIKKSISKLNFISFFRLYQAYFRGMCVLVNGGSIKFNCTKVIIIVIRFVRCTLHTKLQIWWFLFFFNQKSLCLLDIKIERKRKKKI